MIWIDIPPVWLIASLIAAYNTPRVLDFSFGSPWAGALGGLLVVAGFLLMLLALVEMRRLRTTPIPRQEASALVTTGIFAMTRNPIYLGDSLVLLGCVFWWDKVFALALVPLFVWLIDQRFIRAEEDGLKRKFPAQFDEYAQQVRRWL